MKTKRFDFNFRPLQINASLCVEGSVPDRQNYDADIDAYTPDYTLAPLVITPRVSRIDKDNVLAPGPINKDLTNIRWYKIINGSKSLIAADDPDFSITQSGDDSGRILVKCNVQPGQKMTLQFYAEYPDPRIGQVYTIQSTHSVACRNATEAIPRVVLDAADQTVYNPLRDPDKQTVHASLLLGTKEAPPASRLFVWEVLRKNGTWESVGSDLMDYDLEVSADGSSLTVDRTKMGYQIFVRCRAKYDRTGNPAAVTLSNTSPVKTIAFVRRIPYYDYDFIGVPVDIPADVREIAPKPVIRDVVGILDNPTDVLRPVWYVAPNKPTGDLSFVKVAEGMAPVISTDPVNNTNGAVIALDIEDRGPLAAAMLDDNTVFTDADGAVLLIHDND